MILEGILIGKRPNDDGVVGLRNKCNGINLEGPSHYKTAGASTLADCRGSGLNCSEDPK